MQDTYFVDTTLENPADRVRQLAKIAADELPLVPEDDVADDESVASDDHDAGEADAAPADITQGSGQRDVKPESAPVKTETRDLVATSSLLTQSFTVLPAKVKMAY